mgnify:CR=1 FL=1
MATIEPKFKCNLCEIVHDTEDAAIECWRECRDEIPEVSELYVCPLCKLEHSDEDGALECCGYDPDAPPPPTTAEELEAAGQARLVP